MRTFTDVRQRFATATTSQKRQRERQYAAHAHLYGRPSKVRDRYNLGSTVTIRIEAIIPKGATPVDPTAVQRGVDRFLRDFSYRVVREMQEYPPARPWRHPPPTRGPRRGGRRTGAYGRGWGTSVQFTGNSVTLLNSVQYAVYVGGPRRGGRGQRQARFMADRGWKSVSDVAPAIARELRPVLIRRIAGGV